MSNWKQWKRYSSDPITTQSRVCVYCPDTGAEGWASVRWTEGGPQLFGAVCKIERTHDINGTVIDEKVTVIDANPVYCGTMTLGDYQPSAEYQQLDRRRRAVRVKAFSARTKLHDLIYEIKMLQQAAADPEDVNDLEQVACKLAGIYDELPHVFIAAANEN